MALPQSIGKSTELRHALTTLRISIHNDCDRRCGERPRVTGRDSSIPKVSIRSRQSNESAINSHHSAIDLSGLNKLRLTCDVHGYVGSIRIQRHLQHAVGLMAEEIVGLLDVVEREVMRDER